MSACAKSLCNYKLLKGKGIISYPSVLFTMAPTKIVIQQPPYKH